MRKIILVIFILIAGLSSYSQDSLFHYLDIAIKNNPGILRNFAEYKASLEKVPQVGSIPDPELSTGIFLSPMELISGKQVADFRLMQMFPWFGVLRSARDEMSLMAKAKYELFRDAKFQVGFDVQRTWYELNKIKQNIKISEQNIALLHVIERLAITRFKAAPTGNNSSSTLPGPSASIKDVQSGSSGMNSMKGSTGSNTGYAPPAAPMQVSSMGSSTGGSGLSDVYRIQIEIGDLQNNVQLLNSQFNTLIAQFNSYMSRPPENNVVLPDSLVADPFKPVLNSMNDSLSANPMLEMIKYEQKSLDARKQMVSRMGYPMVGIGLNYSSISKNDMSTSTMNGKDMIMPMVTLTLPIYRKKYKAMQNEAALLKSASIQNYKATANSLQNEYYQAMQSYLSAERRIKLYNEQFMLASKSLNIMLKSFASAQTDITGVLRISQQAHDYKYKQTEAVADQNISIAWLKRLLAISQIQ